MSRRKKADYREVLKQLLEILPSASEADHVRLPKSDLGSLKKSVPACENARMCFPLDASPMEKGEINL